MKTGNNHSTDNNRFNNACIRRLRFVPRWAIVPTVKDQNVAEHSFYVAALVRWLHAYWQPGWLGNQGVTARYLSLNYALMHDAGEAVTGDIAAPAKRSLFSEGSDELDRKMGLEPDPEVKNIVKCADFLEALLFCYEENVLGNGSIRPVALHIMGNFEKAWEQFPWWDVIEGRDKPSVQEIADMAINQFCDMSRHPGIEAFNEN